MVGRIGGDEFLVFSNSSPAGRNHETRRQLMNITPAFLRKKSGSKLSCSIGAAVSGGRQHIRAAVPESGYGSYAGKTGARAAVWLRFIPKACGQRKTYRGRFTDGTMIDSENGRYFVTNKVIHYVQGIVRVHGPEEPSTPFLKLSDSV